jgi:hypothetical protein
MKLKCRWEISASTASASWLRRRRRRQPRSNDPTGCALFMCRRLAAPQRADYYLTRNRFGSARLREFASGSAIAAL